MAMFQRSKALLVAAAALLTVTMAIPADAGNRTSRHHHIIKRVVVKNNIRVNNRVAITVVDRRKHHRVRREVDTYSGDVAVYYRRGVGTWSYGSVEAPASSLARHPSAKIIDLRADKSDCSMEKGVCVIRP
jgi:hypothetical protein